MKRVLILGESSYIGTSFQEYVKNKGIQFDIKAVSLKKNLLENLDFSVYDTILYLAALVHKKEEAGMQKQYEEVNTILPICAAKKAKAEGVLDFIFLSTMAVYGTCQPYIDKDTKKQPLTFYGKSKLAAEAGLQQLAETGFRVHILRPPMVYGAGCPGNYAKLAKLARICFVFPNFYNQRSMIYIENLCACICKEIELTTDIYHEVNPQNSEYVNTADLVKQIRKAYGKTTLLVPFPKKIGLYLTKRVGVFEKVFGNLCYIKNPKDREYQQIGFEDSVFQTEHEEEI